VEVQGITLCSAYSLEGDGRQACYEGKSEQKRGVGG